ncbi:MAG: SH3 domain-containing protein [Treponema sp.]|nr:SH3 domain-containing protein [Treponema sp.]
MKKFVLFMFMLLSALMSYAEGYRGMYVNSREGLNVRKSPSMKSEKITTLKYGEYISVVEEGEIVKIDGIKAPWAKILVDYDGSIEDDYKNYGWVFGGYLQEKCPMSEKEIISYLKKLSAENKDFLSSKCFPKNPAINYMKNPDTEFVPGGAEWQKQNSDFSNALPNYAAKYFEYQANNEVVAVRDCFIYFEPVAACAYGWLRFVKAGTKFKVQRVVSWGIENDTLFPIYLIDYDSYIRGIDFTGANCLSVASDGKDGFHTLTYQQLLEDVSMKDVHMHNQWERETLTTSEQLEKYFSNELTYEVKYLHGGFGVKAADYTDPKGKKYRVNLDGKASRFTLFYPLNMNNPLPIIQKEWFNGGMGGGAHYTELYSLDTFAQLKKICEYSYFSADAGFDGMAYHYFKKNGVVTYEYQTDEMGNVETNRQESYAQKNGSPSIFENDDETRGEPTGKSQILKAGQYVNPICRLKLRQSPELSSRELLLLKPGTLLKIVEVGEIVTIDGLRSNWVKVKPVNDDRSVEGYVIKDWLPAESTSAWVFGAYLE